MVYKSASISRNPHRPFSSRPLLAGVAGAVLVFAAAVSSPAAMAQTLPTGAEVHGGQAGVASDGRSMNVRQTSPTAVISWETFSVGQPNSVHFDNGSGATLNRVRGNIASQIDGSLSATGSLYLVNPAGIAVGPTGRVQTGGSFVGSTLDIADEEFAKAARGEAYTLKGDSAATVRNAGRIGSLGGDVALVGRTVENTGDISAHNGTAALAAGSEVLVQDRSLDGGRFVVKAGGKGTSVRNSGNINAAEVELRANGGNVYALAGNRNGVIAATGTAQRGGRVFLTAGDVGTVEVTQRVSARSGNGSAARARNGGEIRVSGRTVKVAATLDASGRVPSVLPPARPSVLDGDGGVVIVTGEAVTLTETARVDVSGAKGGVALVGGDFQGGKDAANNYVAETVATAKTLSVAEGATVAADGAGDAGRIVLWSDDRTDFAGHVSATSATGRGGDAEVSGKAVLSFTGTADLLGPNGAGTLLLDPYDLEIVSDAGTISETGGAFTSGAGVSQLGVGTLTAALDGANIVVKTGGNVGDGFGNGDITVSAAITWTAATTLTLEAHRNIAINAAITAVNGGLTLKAAAGTYSAPTITTGAAGAINVGTFFLETGAWVQNTATLPGFRADDFQLKGGEAKTGNATAPTVTFLRATGGNGSDAANAYTIADVYGLQGAATVLDRHYKLTADINASGTAKWYVDKGFSPIGSNGTKFTGTFDGAGHVITALTIGRSAQNHVGLFGYTESNTIKGIGLVGGSVAGARYVGGLVGWHNGGSINNAYTTGPVNGSSSSVGGLVGQQSGSSSITDAHATGAVGGAGQVGGLVGQQSSGGSSVTNAYATGQVNSSGTGGGLVGWQSGSIDTAYATGAVSGSGSLGGLVGYQNGSIVNAYATGSVTGTGSVIGGLVGQMSGGSITNAYATGAVSSSGGNTFGGLVGWHNGGSITNAFATGAVTGPSLIGGLIGRQATSTSTIANAYATGKVTGSASTAGGLIGERSTGATGSITNTYWDTASTGISKGIGLNPGGMAGLGVTPVGGPNPNAYAITTYTGFTFAAGAWHIFEGETRPLLRFALDDFVDGDTYSVGSAEALQLIRMHTDTGISDGKTYKLTNGLTLNPATGSVSGSGVWNTAMVGEKRYNFLPIGANDKSFQGIFDGQGHVINGLTIERPMIHYVGLFGRTEGAVIENIGLDGGLVRGGFYNVGGLVGEQYGGSISNAYATGEVNGSMSVGGLVGRQHGGSISSAYATGAVNGSMSVGGLVGEQAVGGSISNAYATGAVNGSTSVGGLVGEQAVGGSISNAYATGAVNGSMSVGGLVGSQLNGSISASFWATHTIGQQTQAVGSGSQIGTTGLTREQFNDTLAFMSIAGAEGWDFNTVWAPPSPESTAGAGDQHYPELYALSKVIRVHTQATATYGDATLTLGDTKYYGGPQGWADRVQSAGSAYYVFGPADQSPGSPGVGGVDATGYTGKDGAGQWYNAGATFSLSSTGGGGSAENGYRFVYTGGVTIGKRDITLKAAAGKTYDGTAWTWGGADSVATTGGTSFADNETYATLGAGTWRLEDGIGVVASAINAGNYNITNTTFANADNYNVTWDPTSTLIIDRRIVTLKATAGRTYDGTAWDGMVDAPYSVENGSFVGTDQSSLGDPTAGGWTLTRNGNPVALADVKNAGEYRIIGATFTDADVAANYDITWTADSLVTIDRRAVTLKATADRTYDGTAWDGVVDAPYTVESGSFVGTDQSSLGDPTAGGWMLTRNRNPVALADVKNAGEYLITGATFTDAALAANYAITWTADSLVTVGQALVTINPAAGQQKTIGDSGFQIAFQTQGWHDDTLQLNGSLDHDGAEAGIWAITMGSLSAGDNYRLQLARGATLELVTPPAPEPEPTPQPEPQPNPDPTPQPQPQPQPEPQPEPEPTPQPEPQPEPEPAPTPTPDPGAEPPPAPPPQPDPGSELPPGQTPGSPSDPGTDTPPGSSPSGPTPAPEQPGTGQGGAGGVDGRVPGTAIVLNRANVDATQETVDMAETDLAPDQRTVCDSTAIDEDSGGQKLSEDEERDVFVPLKLRVSPPCR